MSTAPPGPAGLTPPAPPHKREITLISHSMLFYWWPDYADPYSWFINLFHTENPPYFNLTYYSNPSLDSMMQKAEVLAGTARSTSIGIYKQMQQLLYQEVPAISASPAMQMRARFRPACKPPGVWMPQSMRRAPVVVVWTATRIAAALAAT